MNFHEQISGARGVLRWSRAELSKRSGVSEGSIIAIEEGQSNPKQSTRYALISAFLAEGIELTPYGIERREVSSFVLNNYLEVLEDIENTLPDGGEVLKHCADDSRSSAEVRAKVEAMKAKGIAERLTICEGNKDIAGNPNDYRYLPKAYFSISQVVVIYKDKVIFDITDRANPVNKPERFLVIKSGFLARIFKNQFEFWWREGRALDEP
jgi:transcriptional regulator with XRE-family HTH domain